MNLLIITVLHYLSKLNGLNGLILNWCIGGCWFTRAISLEVCSINRAFLMHAVFLWYCGHFFVPCLQDPTLSAIAFCIVLLHLLWVDPPHKLHLMVKVVEAHEVLVENE
jgi:hypothetical protein